MRPVTRIKTRMQMSTSLKSHKIFNTVERAGQSSSTGEFNFCDNINTWKKYLEVDEFVSCQSSSFENLTNKNAISGGRETQQTHSCKLQRRNLRLWRRQWKADVKWLDSFRCQRKVVGWELNQDQLVQCDLTSSTFRSSVLNWNSAGSSLPSLSCCVWKVYVHIRWLHRGHLFQLQLGKWH